MTWRPDSKYAGGKRRTKKKTPARRGKRQNIKKIEFKAGKYPTGRGLRATALLESGRGGRMGQKKRVKTSRPTPPQELRFGGEGNPILKNSWVEESFAV